MENGHPKVQLIDFSMYVTDCKCFPSVIGLHNHEK